MAFGIENVTLIEGEEKDVSLLFVGASSPAISYTFSGNNTSNRYESSFVKAKEVNATLESYSRDKNWFTFIDTSLEVLKPDGTIIRHSIMMAHILMPTHTAGTQLCSTKREASSTFTR